MTVEMNQSPDHQIIRRSSIDLLIAKLRVRLVTKSIKECWTLPTKYILFESTIGGEEKPNITVSLERGRPSAKDMVMLQDLGDFWKHILQIFWDGQTKYLVKLQLKLEGNVYWLEVNSDPLDNVIWINGKEALDANALDWLILIAYSQGCIAFKRLTIHASCVACKNGAYAFLGKSGTGKSTHASLWVDTGYADFVLNDDNPVLNLTDATRIEICGSPWSGKGKFYHQDCLALKGIGRLHQSINNKAELLSEADSYLALLPSCSVFRWDDIRFEASLSLIELTIKNVPVANIWCNLHTEAVEVSKTIF